MILGIDFGTNNSLAAAFKDGEVVIVKSKNGSYSIPSVISIDEDGKLYIGDAALQRKKEYPSMAIDMFKCSLGTEEVFTIGDKKFNAQELSTILLKSIKEEAESFFGEEINEAVISVPAFFNNLQRKSVMQAGKLAGFDVKRIVNEPTATALAYGVQNMKNNVSKKKVIIVLDLGGGTFDISVMEVNVNSIQAVAVCGDNKLGGNDFTERLISLFMKQNLVDEELTVEESSYLFNQAQIAKHQLSLEGKGEIKCTIGNKKYEYLITEKEYEKACEDLLEKIRKLTLQAIKESKYEPYEIEDIIMVGGGTKLSIVKKMIEKMIGKDIDYTINSDEAVVRGMALQGALLTNAKGIGKFTITDICSHYIGTIVFNHNEYDVAKSFDVIIEKNTVLPVKKTVEHYSWPAIWIFQVLQCENELGIDAVELDRFDYAVPDLGINERIVVEKSIIYDENGIIYAEVHIPATGVKYSKVIQTEVNEFSKEEMAKLIENLQSIDFKSKETDENAILLARAERIYSEATGKERENINTRIVAFEKALDSEKVASIEQERENLTRILDMYENMEWRI